MRNLRILRLERLMTKKRIPSHRVHKASGRGVVRINGKCFYTGTYGTPESEAAYRRIVQQWEATNRSTSFGDSSLSMAMLMADYLEFAAGNYPIDKQNSEYHQIKYSMRFLDDYRDLPASEFSPRCLKAVRELMLKTVDRRRKHLKPQPLSRQYVNKMIDRITRMFSWAAEEELVQITVYRALANVKALQKGRTTAPESQRVEPVSDAVVSATLPFLSPVVADMVRVQRLCGMRPGEVCCLTPAMIDRSNDIWIADLPHHKTAWRGKDRVIYIGPKAQQILLKYLLRGADEALFSPQEADRQRRAAIVRNTPANQGNRPGYSARTRSKREPKLQLGTEYTTHSYGRAIKHAIKKAAKQDPAVVIPHWAPNQLRHAAGTEIRKQFGLEVAQVLLGHASRVTTERYAEPVREEGLLVAKAIG